MAQTNEVTTDVKSALLNVIEDLPVEHVAEVLDFALFIRSRQAHPARSEFVYRQVELAKTINALQADNTQGRLYERLMSERAEERARERQK